MTAPAEPRDLVLSSLSWPEIRDIRDHERKEYEAVLTDAQKARLRELLTSKAPQDEPKKK